MPCQTMHDWHEAGQGYAAGSGGYGRFDHVAAKSRRRARVFGCLQRTCASACGSLMAETIFLIFCDLAAGDGVAFKMFFHSLPHFQLDFPFPLSRTQRKGTYAGIAFNEFTQTLALLCAWMTRHPVEPALDDRLGSFLGRKVNRTGTGTCGTELQPP